jgi:mRNA-degrading endonuclease HigB of HigAB toxin-antitoxin module
MQIDKAPSYERDRKKSQNKINPAEIAAAERELLSYPNIKTSYHFKPIKCKKEKTAYSIRIGSGGWRILLSIYGDIIYLRRIVDHDEYDRLNRDC